MTELARMQQGNTVAAFDAPQQNMVGGARVASLVDFVAEMDAADRAGQWAAGKIIAPAHLRGKPGDAAAVILMGQSLGLDPVNAMNGIYVVHGTPALYARTMVGLVQDAGHKIQRVEATEQQVTWRARRRNETDWQYFTWSIDRARRAGYTGNKKYQTDPIGMLSAKASAEACRTIAADVLMGLGAVTAEEAEMGDVVEVSEIHESPAPAPSELRRTVKRKPRGKAPEPQAPDLPPAPAPEPEAEADGEQDAEEAPVMSDRGQWVQAGQLMSDLGIEDKADKAREMREWATSQGITRDLPSMAALTSDECAAFTDYLQSLATGQLAAPEEPEDAS